MATYKKKGYKPKDKKEQEALDMQSTTAEVFNTLDDTASKSEQWIEKNSKSLILWFSCCDCTNFRFFRVQ